MMGLWSREIPRSLVHSVGAFPAVTGIAFARDHDLAGLDLGEDALRLW
jgi:hypothetical protein